MAVSECGPLISEEILNAAVPPLKATVLRIVAASLKVTVPVAVAGVTVAVRVTFWPKVDGFADEVRVVVVVNICATVKVWVTAVAAE